MKKLILFFGVILFLISCSSENTFVAEEKHNDSNPIEKRLVCLFEGTIEEPADWFEDYFSFDEDCNLVTNFPNENVYWSVTLYNAVGTNTFGQTDGFQYGNGSLDIASIAWDPALAYVCVSSSFIPNSQTSSICCGWMSIPGCCCGFVEPTPKDKEILMPIQM